jgi:hypothetical protein
MSPPFTPFIWMIISALVHVLRLHRLSAESLVVGAEDVFGTADPACIALGWDLPQGNLS